jgi:hypothetical protein
MRDAAMALPDVASLIRVQNESGGFANKFEDNV